MQGAYSANPVSHAHACRIVEALCEGYVLAMMAEFEAAPKDEYPCCTKCGEFCVQAAALCPPSREPLASSGVLGSQMGHLDYTSDEPPRRNTGNPPATSNQVRIRSPRQIVDAGGGTTVELACYQAALKRLRGNDPACRVKIVEDGPGTFRGYVQHSDQHENPDKRGTIDDPVVDANSVEICSCGGHGNAKDAEGLKVDWGSFDPYPGVPPTVFEDGEPIGPDEEDEAEEEDAPGDDEALWNGVNWRGLP